MMSGLKIWAFVILDAICQLLRWPIMVVGRLMTGHLEYRLTSISVKIDRLKGEIQAMIGAETQAVLDALNAATSAVAARIQILIDGMDLTPEEKTAFETVITNLQTLATDPNNPAPPI